MRRSLVFLSVVTATLAVVPGWTGDERLALPRPDARVTAEPIAMFDDPAQRRVGSLTFMGGAVLHGSDPAFGGFSALSVDGDRFTAVSDGGTILTFRMGGDWRLHEARLRSLPAGPRTGWRKRDRDVESIAVDPGTGRTWVGFENVNEIWRFSAGLGRAERRAWPPAMRRWRSDGGIEAFTRLRDGRFVALSEARPSGTRSGADRQGLVWSRDPAVTQPAFAFRYRPVAGYDPSDMTELPDGRIVVLERAFGLPFRWYARVMLVERAAIRPGAVVSGKTLARIAAPMVSDNWEGMAATREGGATMLWLMSDDNNLVLQRTLLMKFRLDTRAPTGNGPRPG